MCMLVGHLSDSIQHRLYPVLGHNNPGLFYIIVPIRKSGYLIIKAVVIDIISEHNAWLSCLVGLFSLELLMGEVVLGIV